ncbi:NADH dehydrogenase [Apodemus speciosus]|uniref:NADH dehydrogenase [ubiquinone] 1 beta subcomplex subunit 1 n=1 Tax=Apodemus speciosus TaxID=105296 RepID=A0ABQ0FEN4_APOSI
MTLFQIVREHWVHILVPMGFLFGYYLDRKDDEKLTAFRNKSMLYQRELRPNEEVTWK